MDSNINILGCYISYPSLNYDADQKAKNLAKEQGDLFKSYIWGENGIDNAIKKLKHEDYGKDIMLVLFQFYIKPLAYLENNLKEIENYRKSEKAIGIPIVVTDKNFFDKSEVGKHTFLKEAILYKLDLLAEVVKKKKLDTNVELLKTDINKLL